MVAVRMRMYTMYLIVEKDDPGRVITVEATRKIGQELEWMMTLLTEA